MRMLLENLIISNEIREKVLAYLDRSRTSKVMVDCEVFKPVEFNPFLFKFNLFEQRVDEALAYIGENKVPSHKNHIQVAKDVPMFIDGKPDETMTFHMVLENNWDFVIISLDNPTDDDYGHWMGLYFTGEAESFVKLLTELGIDVIKALQGTLLNPKLPPNGYDSDLTVVENVLKVCCPVKETPDVLVGLFDTLLNKNDLEVVVISDEEAKCMTYEDIHFPIKDTGCYGIIYRNYLNEDQTYVIIVSNDHMAIPFAGVLAAAPAGDYIITQNPMDMHDVNVSVTAELY